MFSTSKSARGFNASIFDLIVDHFAIMAVFYPYTLSFPFFKFDKRRPLAR